MGGQLVAGGQRVANSLGMADASHANLDILKSKHPQGKPVQVPPMAFPFLQVSSQDVSKAISSFPRSSGPGPSGERPSHLCEAVKGPSSGSSTKALESTTWVVNCLLAGRAPKELSPWLAGANLFGLKKKGGGVRPVASGEATRRLTSKLCCLKSKLHAIEVHTSTVGSSRTRGR